MKAAPSRRATPRALQAEANFRRVVALLNKNMRSLERRVASGKPQRPMVAREVSQRIAGEVLEDIALSGDELVAKMMQTRMERSVAK
jgi:hypothetical protein